MKIQTYRYLRGYTIDPGFSTLLDTYTVNETTYRIRWEKTEPGPIGEYFEVIDYDPASHCFYEPIDLSSEEVLSGSGLAPSEGNPQFHQQFVYTVAMKTLEYFEWALGRKVIWHRRDENYEYVPRIRIYPHALREANAFYFPEKRALLFGYFKSSAKSLGINHPGGVVFSCLSPDIVAHEVTHAILESLHPRFGENTNPDVPAFHEAFADLIALLQRFMIPEFLEHQLTRTGGRLDHANMLGDLATQFGNALGHGALRSAIGTTDPITAEWKLLRPNPEDYKTIFEPHLRGAILVATFFDAFLRLYEFNTKDLFRIAGSNTASPDLIKRLAKEAANIAQHLLQISIQALDYCPPFDITFGDYLRALVTADLDMAPSDDYGYRVALIEAFRARGIFPDRVNTLSIESLKWSDIPNFTTQESAFMDKIVQFVREHIRTLLDMKDREQIFHASTQIQGWLHDLLLNEKQQVPYEQTIGQMDVWDGFLNKLGLSRTQLEFTYKDQTFKSSAQLPIEVHNIRPAFRYTREGNRVEQVIVTLTQKMDINRVGLPPIKFRGGCTMIISMSSDTYALKYIVVKNIGSQRRFIRQMSHQLGDSDHVIPLVDGMYDDANDSINISFKNLHAPS